MSHGVCDREILHGYARHLGKKKTFFKGRTDANRQKYTCIHDLRTDIIVALEERLRDDRMKATQKVLRELRRIEYDDVIILIVALAITWKALEIVHSFITPRLLHTLSVTLFTLLASPVFFVVIVVWLFFSVRIRRHIGHRWPRFSRIIGVLVLTAVHSVLKSIVSVLSQILKRPPLKRVTYPLTLTYPASLRDKLAANAIAKDRWGSDTPNTFSQLEWHIRNPNTLAVVRDANNAVLGYFDFLPVKSSFLSELQSGILNEFDVAEQMHAGGKDGLSIRNAEVIYIAGIASARLPNHSDEKMVGALLIYSLVKVICKAVFSENDKRKVTFVAVAYGDDAGEGLKLCEKAKLIQQQTKIAIEGDLDRRQHAWFLREYSLREAQREAYRTKRRLRGLSDHSTPTKQRYQFDKNDHRAVPAAGAEFDKGPS